MHCLILNTFTVFNLVVDKHGLYLRQEPLLPSSRSPRNSGSCTSPSPIIIGVVLVNISCNNRPAVGIMKRALELRIFCATLPESFHHFFDAPNGLLYSSALEVPIKCATLYLRTEASFESFLRLIREYDSRLSAKSGSEIFFWRLTREIQNE